MADTDTKTKIDEATERGSGSYSHGKALGGSVADDPAYVNQGLSDLENYANAGADGSPNDSSDLAAQEAEPRNGSWANNTSAGGTYGTVGTAASGKGGTLNFAKNMAGKFTAIPGRKKGAIGGIVGLVFGAGLGFSALFSPGMLIVHMKELMTERLDTGSLSLETRSNRMLASKLNGATKGHCGAVMTVGCRFSSLSEKNVKNLKANGIEIEGGDKVLGRYRPDIYKFTDSQTGKVIRTDASGLARLARENPRFGAALKASYNPRFSQFNGSPWKFTSAKYDINKNKNKVLSGTPEENDETINKEAKRAVSTDADTTTRPALDEPNPDGTPCDEKCVAGRAAAYDAQKAELDNAKPNAGKVGREVLESVDMTSIAKSTATNALKLTGYADTACTAYGAVRAVGFAAKTVRALQLASYAMIFLKAADEIKNGTADAVTIAHLGGVLTAVGLDVKSTNERLYGSATDSFGYKFLANGDTNLNKKSMNIASQYLAGGGFTGELISFTDTIANALGGKDAMRTTCSTLANPWVQAGSLIGGVALMLTPGVGQAVSGAKIVGQAALAATFQAGMALLPVLMADIVAGTVTDNIKGEHSGNAWFSGGGQIFSSMNMSTGNAPTPIEEVVAYKTGYQQDMIAMHAEQDRATLSPFDTSSKYTFLGSIVNSFMPIYGSAQSLPVRFMSVLNLPLTNAYGTASAASDESVRAGYSMCKDDDYDRLGIAADPFCNVVYIMPARYLAIDPLENAANLEAAGKIDSTGKPIGEFADFVTKCIQRMDPLGYEGTNFSDSGSECKINDENAPMYIYWLDDQADAGMSEEASVAAGGSTASTTPTTPTTTDPGVESAAVTEGFPLQTTKAVMTQNNSGCLKGPTMCTAGHPYVAYDIMAPGNTPIVSLLDGKVQFSSASADKCGTGMVSVYSQEYGVTVSYLHTTAPIVATGQPITKGQPLAKVMPGAAAACLNGSHLHIDAAIGDRRPGCRRENCPAANQALFVAGNNKIGLGKLLYEGYNKLP